MAETPSDFREALVDLIDARPLPAGHPTPDDWLAYQRGELSAGEEARLQEHLVRCRDCFDLAAAAESFAGPDEEPEAGEATASAALWRELRPRLDAPADRRGGEVREISTGAPRRRIWLRWPYALAASFLVALAGMTAWNLRLQGTLAALRAPRPDAPIYDFSAGERPAAEGVTQLAAGTGPWMFVFHPADELPAYRLAIRDAAIGRELSSHELRPDPDLALTLHLPEGLPPGRYRLELTAAGAGWRTGKVLEEHLLNVTEEGGGD